MKYLGSKARVKKELIPVIESYITDETTWYIEPFVGGANVIDKVNFHKKIGYDKHKQLIALLNHVKNGGKLPESISVEEYKKVKEAFKSKSQEYEDWYYGCVGFLAAFRGLFFDTQGCKDYVSGGKIRNNYLESKRNILKQSLDLKNVELVVSDYREIHIPSKSVVYCDPPYQGTAQKGYSDEDNFDYEHFWNWVRENSKHSVILISEYKAPEDFQCVWKREVSTNLAVGSRKKDTEKLFVYKG